MTKIEQIQKISCILLDEFARVCNQNNLRWFIDSGTLLGAIRHGGFIPWDDDVDVVMPREDYNVLYEHGKEMFSDPFFLENGRDGGSDILAMQLKYSNSTSINERSLSYFYRKDRAFSINKGIAMDIEPIDHVPCDERKNTLALFVDFLYSGCYMSFKALHDCHQSMVCHVQYDNGAKLYNSVMTDVDRKNKNSGRVACTPWWPLSGCLTGYTVSEDCYKDYFEADFAGCAERVRIPVGFGEILLAYYGENYMQERKEKDVDHIYQNILIDSERSFHYYEQFSNEEIKRIIKEGN